MDGEAVRMDLSIRACGARVPRVDSSDGVGMGSHQAAVHLAAPRERRAGAPSPPAARVFLRPAPGLSVARAARSLALVRESRRLAALASVLGLAVARAVRHAQGATAVGACRVLSAARPDILCPALGRQRMV